jgi:hypothetical protein
MERTLSFFHHFDYRVKYSDISLHDHHDVLRKPPQVVPRQRVAKLKLTSTKNLSQCQITTSDGTVLSIDDARKNHIDTKTKYQQAYLNAITSLQQGDDPHEVIIDNPRVVLPSDDDIFMNSVKPHQALSGVSTTVQENKARSLIYATLRQNVVSGAYWDDADEKFKAYSHALQDWMAQNQMGYLTDQNIVTAYHLYQNRENAKHAV